MSAVRSSKPPPSSARPDRRRRGTSSSRQCDAVAARLRATGVPPAGVGGARRLARRCEAAASILGHRAGRALSRRRSPAGHDLEADDAARSLALHRPGLLVVGR